MPELTRWSTTAAITVLILAGTGTAAPREDPETLLKKASALHEQADFAHSIPLLARVVQLSPRSYRGNLLLGEDLLASGSTQAALAPLRLASRINPQDATPEVYLAEAAAALEDFPAAVEALQAALARSGAGTPFVRAWASFCLERVRTLGPNLRKTRRGEAMVLRVEAAFRPEGGEARERLLRQSATEDPEQRGIWGELGTAQLELGQRAQVMESLKEAQRREPHGAETLQLQAMVFALQQNWPVAQAALSELAALSPAEFQSAMGLWRHVLAPRVPAGAATWECLRNPAAACPAPPQRASGGEGRGPKDLYTDGQWERLLALPAAAATGPPGTLWRGVALAKTGACGKALPALERGMKADELVAGFWLDICYANEGNIAVARLRKDGDLTAVHQLEGDILLRLHQDAAGAQAEYAEALKAEPRNPHLLERSAEAYMMAGETEAAKKTARAALDVDGHEPLAIKTLAMIALDERDYPEALIQLKQFLEIKPQDKWTRVQLGVTYSQLGSPGKALSYLGPELAAGYPDKKGAFHAQLAAILRKLGRTAEAKQAAAEAERLASAALENVAPGSPDGGH